MEELEHEALAGVLRHECALALAAHEHMFVHQFIHRPAQGADTDLQTPCDGGFAGQGLTGPARTRLDQPEQNALDLAVERAVAAAGQRCKNKYVGWHVGAPV